MTERLVVCLRFRGDGSAEQSLADRAREVARRAVALGGRIVAWHSAGLSLDFAPENLDDAVVLLAEAPLAGCAAGIAEGELSVVVDGSESVALAEGPALIRAAALARIARTGEVVVDSALAVVARGELLTDAARIGVVRGERVRGMRLDLRMPWRGDVAAAIRLARAAQVGEPLPLDFVPTPGQVAVVIAEAGHGGSRILDELAASIPASLRVGPHPVGEPLGALRRALSRACAERPHAADLAAEQSASLESLLAGEGLDLDAASALVEAFCAGEPVLVDDAGEVDVDTVEALARACENGKIALALRIGRAEPLPIALAHLPQSSRFELDVLAASDAAALVQRALGGAVDARVAARVARRASWAPLAVIEAVADAVDGAELVSDGPRIVPRARLGAHGRNQRAEHFIRRRLLFVNRAGRALLGALAVLGGEAELGELGAIVARAHDSLDLERTLQQLEDAHFIERSAELVALPSRTHQRLLAAALPTEELLELHRAAAGVLEASERPLAAASAALHALLGGRGDEAERLARRAAASAEAAGLQPTADALESFALSLERAPLAARGLCADFSWDAPVASRRFGALSEIGPESEVEVSGRAAHALREGDITTIDDLVVQIRGEQDRALLADRLEAMAALARGETGGALRLMRAAKERATRRSPSELCRATLSLGIALAAAGREHDALLEGLEALARARKLNDVRGERACARFLARLSRSAGDEPAAGVWDDLISPA